MDEDLSLLLDKPWLPAELETLLRPGRPVRVRATGAVREALAWTVLEHGGSVCSCALPVGPRVEVVRALLTLSRRFGTLFVPDCALLADPGVLRLREICARKTLGAIQSLTVHYRPETRSEAPTDHLVEALIVALVVLGVEEDRLGAGGVRVDREGETWWLRLALGGVLAELAVAPTLAQGPTLEFVLQSRDTRAVLQRGKTESFLRFERGAEQRSSPLPAAPSVDAWLRALEARDPQALRTLPTEAQLREACSLGLRVQARVESSQRISVVQQPVRALSVVGKEGAGEALLRAVGLALERMDGAAAMPAGLTPREELPVLPRLEAFAFERGLKPALYLTLPKEEESSARANHPGCAVERVPYRLVHDPVRDTRHRENTSLEEASHVDLFIAREPSVAARAAEIYRDPRGPSDRLEEMGELLGYPRCCVRAFAALEDRSDNSAIRYATHARTALLSAPFEPMLSNLFFHVLPSYPCSYACPRALSQARAVLETLGKEHPDAARRLRALLDRPVLYLDHARQVCLDGARWEQGVLRFTKALGGVMMEPETQGPREEFERVMARALALADGLRGVSNGLEILRGSTVLAALTRSEPWLLRVYPFGLGRQAAPSASW